MYNVYNVRIYAHVLSPAGLSFAAGQATYAQQRAMPGWGGRDGT